MENEMQKWLHGLAISFVLSAVFTVGAQARVEVSTVDGNWKVAARDEPLTGVLGAIAQSAGIKVSGTAKLVDDPVMSGVYQGSLETILQRLLRGTDYAFETAASAQGGSRITRLVLLSGVKGKAPVRRAVNTARRLPSRQPVRALSADEKRQGERVNTLLAQRARLGAGMQPQSISAGGAKPDQGQPSSSGITRNADGSFDISPEAQARMAEATRQAQQDLQALVAAIRRNEQNRNNGGN